MIGAVRARPGATGRKAVAEIVPRRDRMPFFLPEVQGKDLINI
jgi:hypothetical protein